MFQKPRVKAPTSENYKELELLMKLWGLNTICEEGSCPNIGECWGKRHAAFMVLGDTCTRNCAFCHVKTGKPQKLDEAEPDRIAQAVKHLGLKHVVVTSVTRDDLPDGGAEHFANVTKKIREISPDTTIEILTPDFLRKPVAIGIIAAARPDVFNHNLETVPRLYSTVRPAAKYYNSLDLLKNVKLKAKEFGHKIFTKSGLMVGLGEKRDEILAVMDDLRVADVDFLTIGQYLQPTSNHHPVIEYVDEAGFAFYEELAFKRGFKMVSASALTRSSYHADEHFSALKNL